MVEAENNLLIFDYSISAEATVTFHAVEYSRDNCRSRIGHRTFLVTEIPFVLHQGPFQKREDAVAMQKDVNEALTDDPSYRDQEEVDVKSRVVRVRQEAKKEAEQEANQSSIWKGPPMAYLHDSMQTASFWIEYFVADKLEKSFHLLPAFKTLTGIIKTLAESNTKLRDSRQGQLWLTDRNIDDSVLRCLAPYNLPGFFSDIRTKQYTNGLGNAAPSHLTIPMRWPDFEKNVLQTQLREDRDRVVFGEKDWQHLIFNVAVISNILTPEGVVIGKGKGPVVYVHTVGLNSRTRTKKHEFTLKEYEAFVKREARAVDLVLIGVGQDQLDKIQANMITEKRHNDEKRQERRAMTGNDAPDTKNNKKTSKWSTNSLYLPPASSHQTVVSKTRYIGPSTLPYSTLHYHVHPFFVIPVQPVSVDELASEDYSGLGWEHEFDICSFMTNLVLKSRVTGRNWSYLSAPLGYSTTSKRAEGIIARRMFRAGYTVLPTGSNNGNSAGDQSESVARFAPRKDSEDTFDEMEDLAQLFDSIHFEGGLNEPVHTQLICKPDMMTNLDFSSFYGAVICIFKLDPCNTELWVTYETELRELARKKQRGSATAADPTTATQEIDTQPIAEFWHKKYKDFLQKSGKTPDQLDAACDWKQYPFANYIREFLLLRQSLQTLLGSGKEEDKTTPLSESRRKSIGEMVEFLKNTVPAAYGTIGYRGNRFFYLPLSTLTPILGRRLILESSAVLKSILRPSMVQIMCVTDSLAYRFPREQRGAMLGFIERFKNEHLGRTYGKLLQIKAVETSHLLMTVCNNYALIRENDKKIEIRGLGPRKAETPPYIADLLTRVLQLFLLSDPINVPFENLLRIGAGEQVLSKHEREVLVDKLARAIEQACGEMQPKCTKDVPANTAGNERYFVYMTHGNALNRHFQFDSAPLPPLLGQGTNGKPQKQQRSPISSKEQAAIDVHKVLGRIYGCVIECSGERGSIVSPCRSIPPAVWSAFYLDISFRQELINTLERLFSFEDIDEAVCRCFPHLGRLATWNGKKVLPGSKQGGGRRSDGTRNTGKDAVKFIEAVSKLAFGETEYENYVAPRLIPQRPNETDGMDTSSLEDQPPIASESAEKVEYKQDAENRLSSQSSSELGASGLRESQGYFEDLHGGEERDDDKGSGVGDDVSDDDASDYANGRRGASKQHTSSQSVVSRDTEVVVPVVGGEVAKHHSIKKKSKKKKKGAKKPLKAAPIQSIVEFMWKFELVCKTCNQASVRTFNDRGEDSDNSNSELNSGDVAANFFKRKSATRNAPEGKKSECRCELCGGSIFGDFMQIDEAGGGGGSGNTIFGLDVKLHCYTMSNKKHFEISGEAALLHPFAVLRNNWQSLDRLKDGLVKILSQQLSTQSQYEERTTLGNLIAAGFISAVTPQSRNRHSEELGLTRLYLDIVVGHLCNHPYMSV